MKTPEQIADEHIKTWILGETWSNPKQAIVAAIKVDRAQREVIPAVYDSSELQGALDNFDEATLPSEIAEAALRLREITNDYLNVTLTEVDGV